MPKRKGCNTRPRVARCAARVAVRLDIRPRLRLAPDWQPSRAARRRLPPLALPAAGYWAVVAGLTYLFLHWGPHPLDDVLATERSEPAVPVPAPTLEPPLAPLATEPALSASPPAEATASALAALDEPAARVPPPEPSAAQERSPQPERRAAGREADRDAAASSELRFRLPTDSAPANDFPEFSDSSKPPPREHAADGPRVGSLFERAETEREAPPNTTESGPSAAPRAPVAVTSCEAAVARNNEQLELGAPRGPADITREAYASVLQNGSYLRGCNIPDRTVFEICAAVKNGRAVGVTVTSSPPSAELNACVRRAVSGVQFPSNERLDVTHTRFDAVKR